MADKDDRESRDEERPVGEAEPEAPAPPSRSVQDILRQYKASQVTMTDPQASEDEVEDEDEDEQARLAAAARREALRHAGVQSSLLDVEDRQAEAMRQAAKTLRAHDEDDEEDAD